MTRQPAGSTRVGLPRLLADGPQPVSIGFGSMAARDSHATLHVGPAGTGVVRAARGGCSAGWAGIGNDQALPPHRLHSVM